MNLKKSLLIALFSFGIAQSAFAETDSEKFDRAFQFIEQQNYSAAFPLFKQLAEQGYARAQFNLSVMYDNVQGVAQSDTQAVYWLEKAAVQGIPEAQSSLGGRYYTGTGVAQSYTQAIYWFTKAAEQGDSQAQAILGAMYALGELVPQDLSKAKQLMGQACKNGEQNACEGYFMLDKKGVH